MEFCRKTVEIFKGIFLRRRKPNTGVGAVATPTTPAQPLLNNSQEHTDTTEVSVVVSSAIVSTHASEGASSSNGDPAGRTTLSNSAGTSALTIPHDAATVDQHAPPKDSRVVRYIGHITPALPFMGLAAEAVPIFGAPVKAVIEGLTKILEGVEKYSQNKQDVIRLKSRIHSVGLVLSEIPNDEGDDGLRSTVLCQLEETLKELDNLRNCPKYQYDTVAQDIARCYTNVEYALRDFDVLNSAHMRTEIRELRQQIAHQDHAMFNMQGQITQQGHAMIEMQQLLKSIYASGVSMTMACIILEDATGKEYSIPMDMATTFEQFTDTMRVLFKGSNRPHENHMLQQYMEVHLYDLCINDGRQVVTINSDTDFLSLVQRDTRVVMRVIVFQNVQETSQVMKCPLCKTPNDIGKSENLMTLCCQCNKKFQTVEADIDTARIKKIEYMQLEKIKPRKDLYMIKNIYIEQYNRRFKRFFSLIQQFSI